MVAYTDGSCVDNGTPRARAGVGVHWSGGHAQALGLRSARLALPPPASSQRAELAAIIWALEKARDVGAAAVEVRTDSMYALKCLTVWGPKWERQGWRTSAGAPVLNQDLIRRARTFWHSTSPVRVTLTKVAAHTGDPGNEEADRLAKAGARVGCPLVFK